MRTYPFFWINYQKSEALSISLPASLTTLHLKGKYFPFKWANSHIKYLGILLPSRMADIFPRNFPPLLMAIRKDLASWQHCLFSWFGLCDIIKMNIMPRLLYHFQALPIPSSFLRAVNWVLVTFLWAQKARTVDTAFT